MKWILGILTISMLFSCQEERKPAPTPKPALVVKDSNLAVADSLNPYAPLDLSPMDMSYYPVDYTIQKMSGAIKDEPVVRVIYSRPHRQGRKIFGGLLKYGEPWRLGANEATEIEFFRSVRIQGKTVPRGKYVIYTIPEEKQWTIALNSNLNSWGLHPDTAKDVFRFTIPVQQTSQPIEYYSMIFEEGENGAVLVMAWDAVVARLPIQTR